MIKCDQQAKAKCPFKNSCCGDEVAYFLEGSECDKFNADVLRGKDTDVPTNAADVVEVVRCKDCKHQEDCMKQLVFWERDQVLEKNTYQYHKLDFCSYGERRGDDG